MSNFQELVKRAALIAGSQAKLAEGIGLSQQGVSFLIHKAKIIPCEIAVRIDRFTNGQVSRRDLRPDIFEDM
jgi:DNA-binding transcriptional regulator YdaS (Cro superfamily)